MKWLLTLLLLLNTFAIGPARAAPPTLSPLEGTWVVDIARLPIPEDARPRSVTIRFAAVAGGRWSTRVEVIERNGNSLHVEGVAPLDGTATPVTGNFEADIGAVRMPASNVLVLQLSNGGVPGSTRVYVVSADHMSMVETAANFGDDGRPVMRTNYFRRASAGK